MFHGPRSRSKSCEFQSAPPSAEPSPSSASHHQLAVKKQRWRRRQRWLQRRSPSRRFQHTICRGVFQTWS
ncbi:unnamed protein product [Linum trigynum]|uniref:Uncharacterized protein n=1 Tax=Linum trigynum TaxID=586398 RepID=A0AAV2EY89_9ROSI